MSLKFSLKCLQGIWRRHFWWHTVPCFCCKRSDADRGQTCQCCSQCWDWWWAQALSTRKSSNGP